MVVSINSVTYKAVSIDVFFDYRKQLGRNFLYYLTQSGTSRTPGTIFNQPISVLDRWQNPGDVSEIEKYSITANSTRANLQNSNAVYSDQSFIRMRNIQVLYNLPVKIAEKIGARSLNLYIQGQNLFTWNKDKHYNPETQSLNTLAPLKSYVMGIRVNY